MYRIRVDKSRDLLLIVVPDFRRWQRKSGSVSDWEVREEYTLRDGKVCKTMARKRKQHFGEELSEKKRGRRHKTRSVSTEEDNDNTGASGERDASRTTTPFTGLRLTLHRQHDLISDHQIIITRTRFPMSAKYKQVLALVVVLCILEQ
ncbi:unnamed protein product [Medioppia subpectinata]|uniref:Uncharacterized protein n=1 Tax=Medioppia subpectinata TaxID=1979941 RepID=A0A7R9Q713_9ACAR|nr:unnamed protein product [Medioppia subpectinata]CAG2115229.1 unnamed protein product [Medioppia subpectinata]